MPLPGDDPLERPERRRERFPSLGIRPEKLVEGNLLTLSDITPAGIGAALTDHGHLRHNLSAITDPGVTDDEDSGYSTGSVWVNISTPKIFVCVTAAEGAADWNQTDAIAAAADHDHTGGGDGGVLTKPELDDYLILGEISAPGGDPAANKGWLYVKDDGGTSGLYFEADDGTVTDLLAGGGGAHASDHAKDGSDELAGETVEVTVLETPLITPVSDDPIDDITIRTNPNTSSVLILQGWVPSAFYDVLRVTSGQPVFDAASGGAIQFVKTIRPTTDNAIDLGTSAKTWRHVYLKGLLDDGAGNAVSVAMMVDAYDKRHTQETYIPFGNEPEAGVTIFPT